MKDAQDAFGHAILDYFHGENLEEAGRFGCRTWFSKYHDWFEREKTAITHAKGRVLDIGCAAGRHALFLQERGHKVLAIDNSPLAVRICRKRRVKNAKIVPVTQISYQLGLFDTILMLGNNFGLVGNLKRGQWLLRRFKRMTPSEGIIIAGNGFDINASDTFRKQVERNIQQGKMAGEFSLRLQYKHYTSPLIHWLYTSKEDMCTILNGTGWYVDNFIEDGTGAFVGLLRKEHA